jgi:hypothetical protein
MNEMAQRVARQWRQLQQEGRRVTPTEFAVRQLRLPVSDARFDRVMQMAARDMGGTYHPATSTIKLPPQFARAGDRSFPTELLGLYRKFPCGALMKTPGTNEPVSDVASLPCVSFDLIPNVPGDPRRSRIYKSFQGDVTQSKRLMNQFVGWLKIISKAVKRYVRNSEQGRAVPFGRVAAEEELAARVARAWLLRQMR